MKKERRLTEKTKFNLSIITLIFMILFVVSTTFAMTTWKEEIEHQVELNTDRIEITQDAQGIITNRLQKQDGLFIEIKTDLKWIRSKLEEE